MFFASGNVTVLQITQAQGIIAIAVFLGGVVAAWTTQKMTVKHISDAVTEIKSSVKSIQNSISTHKADIAGLKAHTKYGVINSPIVPSDDGKRVLKESGFDDQYPKMKARLFRFLDKKGLRTLYDIEKSSLDALKSLVNDPLMDPMKDYAVNHPSESLDLIMNIGSWVLRDDYATSKGIPTKHDKKPTK